MLFTPPASTALLAALRGEGRALELAPEVASRAADGDPEAATALEEHRQALAGWRLGEQALARERVEVVLDDGAALPLDEAELLLARKEERRPHRPLRRSLDRALASVRNFSDHEIVDASRRSTVDAWLSGTADLAEAALAALQAIGGAEVNDELALAWVLDLPLSTLHSELALKVVAIGRSAAGVPLRSVRVPRALAGVAFLDEEPRLAVFAGPARAHRFFRMVRGGFLALAAPSGRRKALGEGLALGALAAPVLRAAGLSRRDAERVGRVGMAAGLLRVRAGAALALTNWPEALERAIPLSVRPSDSLRELLDEPVADEGARDLLEQIRAAAAALALQDAHDEAFAVDAGAWREPIDPLDGDDAACWTRWLGPWL